MSIRKHVFLLAPAAIVLTACETEAPITVGKLHKGIKADGQGGVVETDKNLYLSNPNDPNYPNSMFSAVGAPKTFEIPGTPVPQKTPSPKNGGNPVPFLKYNRSIVAILGNPNAAVATSIKQTTGVLWYRIWIPTYDPANPGTWSDWAQSNTSPDTDIDKSDPYPMYKTKLKPGKWQFVQSPNQTVIIKATLDDGSTQIWTGTWSGSSGRGSISWTGVHSK